MDGRVVAGVRFDYDVGVGRFAVDLCDQLTIFLTVSQYIKKGNFAILFHFSCKADAGMDAVKALIEGFSWISLG